ncbi:MAG: hypothetical protein EBU08_05970 [Micrococcales bacterium]|nr:hypothetical protein [Micrococcales bacterium]
MSKTYLLINTSNNIVENAVVWDGNTETWQPPSGFIALDLETTPSVEWEWNADLNDWVPVDMVGTGSIGDSWDGQKSNAPKPPPPPPPPAPVDPANQEGPSVIAE